MQLLIQSWVKAPTNPVETIWLPGSCCYVLRRLSRKFNVQDRNLQWNERKLLIDCVLVSIAFLSLFLKPRDDGSHISPGKPLWLTAGWVGFYVSPIEFSFPIEFTRKTSYCWSCFLFQYIFKNKNKENYMLCCLNIVP